MVQQLHLSAFFLSILAHSLIFTSFFTKKVGRSYFFKFRKPLILSDFLKSSFFRWDWPTFYIHFIVQIHHIWHLNSPRILLKYTTSNWFHFFLLLCLYKIFVSLYTKIIEKIILCYKYDTKLCICNFFIHQYTKTQVFCVFQVTFYA